MQRFLLSGSTAFLLLPWTGLLRAATVYDNGAPNLRSGFELTQWIEANNFTLATGALIKNIQFWDLEKVGYFQSSILWEIHADNGGMPGNLLFSGTSMNLTHAATGRSDGFGYTEFVATFDIAQASLGPGNYWLVLHNGPLTNNSTHNVFWETAANPSTVQTRTVIAPFTGSWDTNGANSQLAFNLSGIVGPSITAINYHSASPQISFTTLAGQRYSVQYKNLLTDSTWLTLSGAENIAGTGGVVQVTDLGLGNLKRRFYRALLLP